MEKIKDDASIPDTSSEHQFNIGAEADITGSEIEKVLKAKLGAEWSASQNNTLSVSSPRYIGFRMAQLKEHEHQKWNL